MSTSATHDEALALLRQRMRDGLSVEKADAVLLVLARAAEFTEASDRGDDAADRFENAKSETEADAAAAEGDAADDAYNRSKDELFHAVRALMGWPARPAQYPPKEVIL